MKTKIRFITTIISLVAALLVLIIALPISIYAARTATISGSGNLYFKESIETQNTKLKDAGFATTSSNGTTINLQRMEEKPDNPMNSKYNAMNSGILRYKLYRKVDCENSTEYTNEFQVILDFSRFNILKYSQNFLYYYNDIALCENIENIPLYNFYSGAIEKNNVTVKLNEQKDGLILEYQENDTNHIESVELVYRIILNNYYVNGEIDNIQLSNKCFKFDSNDSTTPQINIIPKIIYIDISQMQLFYTNGTLVGIRFGSDGDISGTDLTDSKHIHVIGANDSQYEIGLIITKEYIASHSDYEVSIYKKISEDRYSILCKVESVSNSVKITVIDDAYYSSDTFNDAQKTSILNMCYWLNAHSVTNVNVYHQRIKEDMSFTNSATEIFYGADDQNKDLYRVYYNQVNDQGENIEVVIGYFDNKGIVNVTTN